MSLPIISEGIINAVMTHRDFGNPDWMKVALEKILRDNPLIAKLIGSCASQLKEKGQVASQREEALIQMAIVIYEVLDLARSCEAAAHRGRLAAGL